MWARRCFLRRSPNPLITSHVPSIHRHDATQSTVLGGRKLNAARRGHVSDATDGLVAPSWASSRFRTDQDDRRRPAAAMANKRHLYLVLDDQMKDYGIYKLDADADLDGDSVKAPPRLPHPALIRLDAPEEHRSAQFAAAGSCIVAMGSSHFTSLAHSGDYGVVTILYDTRTPAMSVSTHPTDTLQYGYEVAVPVGKRLYVLDSQTNTVDSFHVMTTSKAADGEDEDEDEVKQGDWGWYGDSGSSRIGWTYGGKARDWSERLLFEPGEIEAHAVHPRGRMILVSVRGRYHEKPCPYLFSDGYYTFAYDTTSADCEWTCRGRWALPFKGHAVYDGELNAWVGLHVDDESDGKGRDKGTDGYLCACDVPDDDDDDDDDLQPPELVVSTERILLEEDDPRRVDFKLVYMAEHGEYCLVERLRLEGADHKEECIGREGGDCLLRLTTFSLKYGYSEHLDYFLTITDRRTTSYKVARYRQDFQAQAFWL